MREFFILLQHNLEMSIKYRGSVITVVGFFTITIMLFPFGVGPEPGILARIAPGIIWVAALFSSLLSLDQLFAEDVKDGTLDAYITANIPISIYVLAKITAHWFAANLPIIILAPILALTLQMHYSLYPSLVIALCLGTPAMSLIGSVGAALTIGTRRNGVLMPLLVLPLYIPTLIFGVGAVETASMGFTNTNIYAALTGISLIAAGLAPWAAATALRTFNE